MFKNLCRIGFLAAIVTLPCVSNAAVITQLSGSAGLTLSNDFETTLNNADVTFNGSAAFGAASTWSDGTTPSGANGLVLSQEDSPLVGALSSSRTAVGMWFGNDDFNYVFDVILEVYSGASLLGSVNVVVNRNDKADQFIGLSSDTAFDSFHVIYQRPQAQNLSIYIDDLYLGGSASVPESSGLILLALGMLGLVIRRKTSN